ncbi:fibrous sheath-interacting protein 1 isoform X2 [Eucyclogobius newberryi]|uniref:fibrous sheath-interacting protein 1 isoform X2 n=1 Tax=Eucyclogobius newberryi TaxID=166745 RepID=UPI003B5AC1A3
MEIFRGQLDNISRPASSEVTGSRVSSVSLPHSERIRSSALSLVVLTNDIQSGIGVVSGGGDVSATDRHGNVEEDVNLQKAIEEMRRLDEILSLKAVQEQEAKRQRKELRNKLWQELLNTPKGRSECALESSNTRSFLALDAPASKVHEEELNYEPVFETEAPDCDGDIHHVNSRSIRSAGNVESETYFLETEQVFFQGSHCEASKSKKKHKDFVKRNIELISSEGGQEVLTQPEKERLDELLREIAQEEEDCARCADAEDYVWAVSAWTGQGYTPEPPDLQNLNDIDSRIRLLLPVEEFASLQASFSNLSEFQDEVPDLTEEQLQSLLEECELAETWTSDIDANDFTPR